VSGGLEKSIQLLQKQLEAAGIDRDLALKQVEYYKKEVGKAGV
jgi:hypothetical protein